MPTLPLPASLLPPCFVSPLARMPSFSAHSPPLAAAPSVTATANAAVKRKQRAAAPPVAAPPQPPPAADARAAAELPLSFSYPRTRAAAARGAPSTAARPLSARRHYVFVYGTLKRGFANSYLLAERATYVGDFRTATSFPLVVGGKYNSPYLLDMPRKGARVKGELYVVDDAVLADLDHLENVGVNYERAVTRVHCCADRSFSLHAFVYLKQNNLAQLCKKQFLDDYQCRLYVPRHMRVACAPPAE